MRWCTYIADGGTHRVGLIEDGDVRGIATPLTLIEVIRSPEAMAAAERLARQNPVDIVALADVRLAAPVPVPPSVRDFMAFEEHVRTSNQALGLDVHPVWYEIPVFYFSNPAAILGPHDDVPIAPGCVQWDFELEIAAIIGLPGRDIAPADALDHIAGFSILNDWSARDLQSQEMALHLGPAKGKDTATSLGPVLVTPDELERYRSHHHDPRASGVAYDLEMTATVNGRPYSRGNLSTIHHDFGALIERASRGTELRTGDVIGSGTVGTGCILELSRVHGTQAYPWLVAGDVVTLSVEHLGEITSTVVPAG